MSKRTARAVLDGTVSEADFEQQVTALAKLCGWRVFHPWLSLHSTPGWPDLFLVKDGRAICLELKAERGRLSRAQSQWLDALDAVPGITARCARPSDWDELERLLKGAPCADALGDGSEPHPCQNRVSGAAMGIQTPARGAGPAEGCEQ